MAVVRVGVKSGALQCVNSLRLIDEDGVHLTKQLQRMHLKDLAEQPPLKDLVAEPDPVSWALESIFCFPKKNEDIENENISNVVKTVWEAEAIDIKSLDSIDWAFAFVGYLRESAW